MKVSMQSALIELTLKSDFVSQFVVFLLIFMSVICWTIFFYKLFEFKYKTKKLTSLLKILKEVKNFRDLSLIYRTAEDSVDQSIVQVHVESLSRILKQDVYSIDIKLLNDERLELLRSFVDQKVNDISNNLETYLSFLSVSGAVSPLLGLFGTIWGLIHSFVSISYQKTADIAAVAPGIAEALITTLAGLIVAIPAMIMFHYLVGRIRHINTLLDDIVILIENIIKTEKNFEVL